MQGFFDTTGKIHAHDDREDNDRSDSVLIGSPPVSADTTFLTEGHYPDNPGHPDRTER
jgi:hypothetical protein